MWFPLGVGGGLLGRYDPVQKRTAGLFWAETHRTTAKPAISRPSERLSGRCHRAADDFPCPKQRPPKPILDKSVPSNPYSTMVEFSVKGPCSITFPMT